MLTEYTTIEYIEGRAFGPEREPNRPRVTGRGARIQKYYNPEFEVDASPVASEEMPALASVSPSPTKPFLLTRNANGTLRRLRRGEKAVVRRRSSNHRKTRRS